jgi:hypothetical protein
MRFICCIGEHWKNLFNKRRHSTALFLRQVLEASSSIDARLQIASFVQKNFHI